MQEIKREIKIRLPLTMAEKVCLSQFLSICPKACNYVSKYVYKNKVYSQTKLFKAVYTTLKEKYNLSQAAAKAVIKTVVARYKEETSCGSGIAYTRQKKWRRLRFTRKDCLFYYRLNYYVSAKSFYIDIHNTRVKLKPTDYDKYFGAFDKITFGPATIQNNLFGCFLCVPITVTTKELTRVEETFADMGITILWLPMKRRLLQR